MYPKQSIQVKSFKDEEMVIVCLQGELGDPSVVREAVEPFIGVMRSIVFDVQHLKYINSACFGVFFQLNYMAKDGVSKLYFLNVQSHFGIIFHGLGGDNVFRVIETIDDI